MTEQTPIDGEAPTPAPFVAPPDTGNSVVDQALADLGDLDAADLAQHHDRLSAAQDVLAGVLDSSRGAVQTPIPGVLRPNTAPGHRG